MATTLEKLETDFMIAKTEYEKAQKTLEEKKEIFETTKKKRNKKMCKELETLFSNFFNCVTHSENFFNAFSEMEKLGVDSEETLFQDIDTVLLNNKEDMFIVRQIHTVDYYEAYECDTLIPVDVSMDVLVEIVNRYLQKEKELKEEEEKKQKQARYEQYLRLKKEFEG